MILIIFINAVNDTEFAKTSTAKEDYFIIGSNSVCLVFSSVSSEMQVRLETITKMELFHKSEADKIRLTPIIQILPTDTCSTPVQPLMIELMKTVKLKQKYENKCSIFLYFSDDLSEKTFKRVKLDIPSNTLTDRISFQANYFGIYAVVAHVPPSSSMVTLQPNGNSEVELELPEVSGLKVYIPSNSINCTSPLDIKATIYYCDPFTTWNDNETTLASPCITLEPHGLSLLQAVTVTFPIPDWEEITLKHPDIELQLWYNPDQANSLQHWSILKETKIVITRDSSNMYYGSFTVSHFSSFMARFRKFIRRSLSSIFSNCVLCVKKHCQVFMSKETTINNPSGDMLGFAIAVVILPFETNRACNAPQGYNYCKLSDSGDESIEFNSDTSYFSAKVLLSKDLFANASQEQLLQNKQAKLPEDLDSARRVEFNFTTPYVILSEGAVLGQLNISQSSNDSSTSMIIKDCCLIKVCL